MDFERLIAALNVYVIVIGIRNSINYDALVQTPCKSEFCIL